VILVSGAQGASARDSHPELFAAIFDKPYDRKAMLKAVAKLLDTP
jgi:hypothetical protein